MNPEKGLFHAPVEQPPGQLLGPVVAAALISPQHPDALLRRLRGKPQPRPGKAQLPPLRLIRQKQHPAVLDFAPVAPLPHQGKPRPGAVHQDILLAAPPGRGAVRIVPPGVPAAQLIADDAVFHNHQRYVGYHYTTIE